jgi:two-component system, chemotaxis family, response regulator Rcp1
LGEFQILLIDDSASDAKLFERALQQSGTRVRVYWVASAQEGLEYLRQAGRFAGAGPVRLVVSDLSMVGISGFEFLSRAREDPALSAIPIVIMSSSRSPRDILRCYELGANSYITKPMSLETFATTVGAMVRYWLDIVELPDLRMMD